MTNKEVATPKYDTIGKHSNCWQTIDALREENARYKEALEKIAGDDCFKLSGLCGVEESWCHCDEKIAKEALKGGATSK